MRVYKSTRILKNIKTTNKNNTFSYDSRDRTDVIILHDSLLKYWLLFEKKLYWKIACVSWCESKNIRLHGRFCKICKMIPLHGTFPVWKCDPYRPHIPSHTIYWLPPSGGLCTRSEIITLLIVANRAYNTEIRNPRQKIDRIRIRGKS